MRAAALAALLALTACNGTTPTGSAPSASATTTPAPSASASASAAPLPVPEYGDAKLPVPADFEDEADRTITKDNYREELEQMEKALADPPSDLAASASAAAAPPSASPPPSPAPGASAPKAP